MQSHVHVTGYFNRSITRSGGMTCVSFTHTFMSQEMSILLSDVRVTGDVNPSITILCG